MTFSIKVYKESQSLLASLSFSQVICSSRKKKSVTNLKIRIKTGVGKFVANIVVLNQNYIGKVNRFTSQ